MKLTQKEMKEYVDDLLDKLEEMRGSLDKARQRKDHLEKARPLLKFIGYNIREPWEMLSLRERLKTVEEALRLLSRELA